MRSASGTGTGPYSSAPTASGAPKSVVAVPGTRSTTTRSARPTSCGQSASAEATGAYRTA